MEFILISISLLIGVGIMSQWLAWRYQIPAIIIMTLAGVLAGPILGLFDPRELFGDLYSPIISFAVAIILFEGSLGLHFSEINQFRRSIVRIVTIGVALSFVGMSLLIQYVGGLHWVVAWTMGALFVVTGPTVVIPLLRQAHLKDRVGAILKWEGIIVDPVGALLGLFVVRLGNIVYEGMDLWMQLLFAGACILGIGLGYLFGHLLMGWFVAEKVPRYLRASVTLTAVLVLFSLSELMMHEVGLLAVTAMGMTMANTKHRDEEIIEELQSFKEDISILLISSVFILLTASLSRAELLNIFQWPLLLTIAGILFLVRPVAIYLSTIGGGLPLAERGFIGWIAPRGIVAMTVAGFFAEEVAHLGIDDAKQMLPLTLGLVFISVTLHGLTIRPLARKLKLIDEQKEANADE
ncbi:MAG: sodium:proton antiporter [Exiguobacterium sp.]|uniref:cation:proton antiporter n=1 Tax=unclassified Exiguobacterium TaxID=2644629 RepID=UPI001BE9FCE9|nr:MULTISPECIES: sodium:proton antiporter [unclassified Exiguobacterium]MBQ6460267.1 sodium:proton antiporter [Exiguobacterium sp.]